MSLTIMDFILIYNLIPLFCLDFGIPIASLDSSLLRLNQLTCDTPSIVKSNYWCPLKIFGDFRDFYFLGQPIYWTHK